MEAHKKGGKKKMKMTTGNRKEVRSTEAKRKLYKKNPQNNSMKSITIEHNDTTQKTSVIRSSRKF